MRIGSAQQMKELGASLASHLRVGDVLLLSGPLGAGKTALAQGIAQYLGISGVTSPTFVISRIHPAGDKGIPLVHIDAYRLTGSDGSALFDDLDLLDFVEKSVTLVEWGEGLVNRLADQYLEVAISHTDDENQRSVEVKGYGERWDGFTL